MKMIRITEFLSTQLFPEYDSIRQLGIAEKAFDSGAYGEIYHCESINGKKSGTKLVIKILNDDGSGSAQRGIQTIRLLQRAAILFNQKAKNDGSKQIQEMDVFAAFPQFSFLGKLGNKQVVGYGSIFLESSEYLLFDRIFNEEDKAKRKQLRTTFYKLPLEYRLKMADDLVEGFQVFEKMNFVYADLNPKNFFVGLHTGKLTLIDFDSGGFINQGGGADVFGKLGEWLAPEIQKQILENQKQINVNFLTDNWSVAIAIHFLMFNFHPLFFLKIRGRQEMQQYFAKYQWPEANTQGQNFRHTLQKIYETYRIRLQHDLPLSLYDAFFQTINQGYFDPQQRFSYESWRMILSSSHAPPEIEFFESDQAEIIEGLEVALSWKVHNAYQVFLNGHDVTGKTDLKVRPSVNEIYSLKAIGHFGEERVLKSIKVHPCPKIERILIPDFCDGIAAPPIDISPQVAIYLPEFTYAETREAYPYDPAPANFKQGDIFNLSNKLFAPISTLISNIENLWQQEHNKHLPGNSIL